MSPSWVMTKLSHETPSPSLTHSLTPCPHPKLLLCATFVEDRRISWASKYLQRKLRGSSVTFWLATSIPFGKERIKITHIFKKAAAFGQVSWLSVNLMALPWCLFKQQPAVWHKMNFSSTCFIPNSFQKLLWNTDCGFDLESYSGLTFPRTILAPANFSHF